MLRAKTFITYKIDEDLYLLNLQLYPSTESIKDIINSSLSVTFGCLLLLDFFSTSSSTEKEWEKIKRQKKHIFIMSMANHRMSRIVFVYNSFISYETRLVRTILK